MGQRVAALRRWAASARPDVALSHNSYAQISAARLLGIPIVTAMDYEHQPANHLAFRLADRILMPAALPSHLVRRQGATVGKTTTYPGFKEEMYVGDFCFDESALGRAGVDRTAAATIVITRPPPSGAAYHQFANPLYAAALKVLAAQASVCCVALTRTAAQREALVELGLTNFLYPSDALDARSLMYSADLVVGGGGTMTREAALLGVPTYTVFAGRRSAVDDELVEQGRLRRLHSPEELAGLAPRTHQPVALAELRRRSHQIVGTFVGATVAAARRRAPLPSERPLAPAGRAGGARAMCGIAGMVTPGAAVDPGTLGSMVAAMTHRGPDGSGHWIDGEVGLGMRRLAIVDVAGGEQPLSNEDGGVRVVFNGEIYNHQDLRRWLAGRGHRLASRTDGEVIAHAYEELGERFVERLDGIFAIALWDTRNRRLVLARDALGVKPLYIHRDGAGLSFASELKALLRHPRVPRRLDLRALDEHLTFRFTPAPRTLLDGVEKLEPATTLVLCAGRATRRRHWDAAGLPRRDVCFQGAADELRDRFELAVQRQMMSDRPIGAMLSGGIDSAAVVAMMAHSSSQVKTFTVGFEGGGDADETGLARETAALFGTDHAEIILPASDFARDLEGVVEQLEEPVATSSAIGFRAVSRLASTSVPVLLSGQGADEMLAGYWRHVGEWLASPALGAAARLRLDGPLARLAERTTSPRLERGLRAVRHPDPLARFMNIYAVFTEDQKDLLYRPQLREFLAASEEQPSDCVDRHRVRVLDRDPLGQMLHVDTRLWLPDDLLLVGDKMSMAESVEMRVPFLDRELVEFIESLPTKYKLRRGQRKAVLKRAMRGVLPARIIHRRERGFATPIGSWLRDDPGDHARRVLLETPRVGGELFDLGYVERLVGEHRRGAADHARKLFSLVSLELWGRRFLGGPIG